MRLREAKLADFQYLERNTISRRSKELYFSGVDTAFTLEHEGVVLAMGGFRAMTGTTAWVWLDLTPDALTHRLDLVRAIHEQIDEYEEQGFRRLMAVVEPDFPEAIRTIIHLGFHLESTMPQYYNDKDGLLYVRLKGA